MINVIENHDGDNVSESDGDQTTRKRCRCDCEADDQICGDYKRGEAGFSIEDRR